VRYINLAEALVIAEAVTGIDVKTLTRTSRINLLDSALHAPRASFGGEEFYPDFIDKAAVLVVHVARNHPLIDGNKRLAWQVLTMFCSLNGQVMSVPTEDAVATMLAIAGGELDEPAVARWVRERLRAAT
jgi:death-on-curing protein